MKYYKLMYDYENDDDYIANLYGWLIVTGRFWRALSDFANEKDYQLLPVTLIEKNTRQQNETCKVINILDVIDGALDYDESDYSVFEVDDEKILSVRKYVLKAKRLEGHDIFRLKENMVPIFVSEKIKNMVEDNALTGFSFLEVRTSI